MQRPAVVTHVLGLHLRGKPTITLYVAEPTRKASNIRNIVDDRCQRHPAAREMFLKTRQQTLLAHTRPIDQKERGKALAFSHRSAYQRRRLIRHMYYTPLLYHTWQICQAQEL
jgi:hypothetical protein